MCACDCDCMRARRDLCVFEHFCIFSRPIHCTLKIVLSAGSGYNGHIDLACENCTPRGFLCVSDSSLLLFFAAVCSHLWCVCVSTGCALHRSSTPSSSICATALLSATGFCCFFVFGDCVSPVWHSSPFWIRQTIRRGLAIEGNARQGTTATTTTTASAETDFQFTGVLTRDRSRASQKKK